MRAVSTDPRGPQPSAMGLDTETRPETRSVLVVDDAPMLRRAIAEMLARANGKQAVLVSADSALIEQAHGEGFRR